MSLITQATTGQTLTVSNVSGKALAIGGKTLFPGKTLVLKLASFMAPDVLNVYDDTTNGNPMSYFNELHVLLSQGLVSAAIDGVEILSEDAAVLDYPKDGAIQMTRDIWNNLAVADVNAIKIAFAAEATDVIYAGTDLDGAVGPGAMSPPRNFTCTYTTGGGEAILAKDIVVVGLDINGAAVTETISLTGIGAMDTHIDVGVQAFKTIVSIAVPGDVSAATGDYEFGFGAVVGLSAPLVLGGMIRELLDNALAVAGTVVLAGSSLPNGTYTPNHTPDGVHDYIVVFAPG